MPVDASSQLLQKDFVSFDETIEPVNPVCNPSWGLTVQQQWNACKAIHWLLLAWVAVFCSDYFSSETWLGYSVNNLFPIVVFATLCVPMCVSMIGFMPHKVAFVVLLWNFVAPFLMIYIQAGAPFMFAYVSGIFMTFMYLAIHLGKAGNQHDIGDWGSVLQVNLIATFSALFYLWQFSTHCPLNYKLRWVMMAYSYWKAGIKGALDERKGKREVFDPAGAYRTYFLNDVQFIRVFFARISIMLALFSMVRMLEEKVCPMEEVLIEGAFNWIPFESPYLFPHNFTKTIPVCPW